MENDSLPFPSERPPIRTTPLPSALYVSNGLIFELYDGGQPYRPQVILWERPTPAKD